MAPAVSPSRGARPALFPALPPRLVPTPLMVHAAVGPAIMREVAACAVTMASGAPEDAVAVLVALRGRPPIDDVRAEATNGLWQGAATRPEADTKGHDHFFRIQRVAGANGAVFLHSVVVAALLFHAEMAAEREPRRQAFRAVAAGFAALLGYIGDAATAPIELEAEPAPAGASTCIPARRWVIGHQVFATLTQGLIMALHAFEASMAEGDDEAVGTALALAADLLLASAAAFRFACDFPPEAYRDVIRPSMMPPHVAEGFSGLLSYDHRYLVQLLTRLRPLMAAAEAQFPAAHARMALALERVYADHKFICARFGGADAPSLRGRTCSHLSGVEQLENYRHARLRLLHPGAADNGTSQGCTGGDAIGPIE